MLVDVDVLEATLGEGEGAGQAAHTSAQDGDL